MPRLTVSEMIETAIALHPKLRQRALELHTGHDADADDLLQDTFETFVRKPPEPRTPNALLHWLRTVMLNLRRKQWRKDHPRRRRPSDLEIEVVSWDVVSSGWSGD